MGGFTMKVKLSKENDKIKQELISNFKNSRLTVADIDKDIVKLIADMTTQALQMSQKDKEQD